MTERRIFFFWLEVPFIDKHEAPGAHKKHAKLLRQNIWRKVLPAVECACCVNHQDCEISVTVEVSHTCGATGKWMQEELISEANSCRHHFVPDLIPSTVRHFGKYNYLLRVGREEVWMINTKLQPAAGCLSFALRLETVGNSWICLTVTKSTFLYSRSLFKKFYFLPVIICFQSLS